MPCCGINFILIGERLTELRYYLAGLRPCVIEVTHDTKVRCWLPPNLRRAVKHDESLPLVTNGAASGGGNETLRAATENAAGSGSSSPSTDMGRVKSKPRMPLLLLHGFGASAIWQWSKQVRFLSSRYDVIMPDLVFFGGSWSSSPLRSEQFQADVMLRLMDRLSVPRFHCMGLSYGGFVAYRIAKTAPDRVRRLVLVNSGLLTTRGEFEDMLHHFGVASSWELLLPTTADGVQRLIDLANFRPPKVPPWILRDTIPVLFNNRQEKTELLQDLMEHLDTPPTAFPSPAMPTLLVWGDSDSIFPPSIARRMHGHFGPPCELIVLKDATHMSCNDQPHKFNEAVGKFLASPSK